MSDKPLPQCCQAEKAKEVFDAIFDRMPWLYDIFFRWPLREHDLSTLLNILHGFNQNKLTAQKAKISTALHPLFQRMQGYVRQPRLEKRAYELWEAAGRPAGDGKEFWRQAESEDERNFLVELVNVLGYHHHDLTHSG